MGTSERREREAEGRRRAILGAARTTFWKRGFSGATMPAIAQAAELAPGTLYLYFPSKDALYAELLVEGYDLLLGSLEGAVARPGLPRRQAAAMIDAFAGFARDHPEYFDIMFFVLRREGGAGPRSALEPEQVARLAEREEACKAVAARVLARARRGGRGGTAKETVEAVWSMLAGVIFFFGGSEAFPRIAGEAKRLVLKAVFGREA